MKTNNDNIVEVMQPMKNHVVGTRPPVASAAKVGPHRPRFGPGIFLSLFVTGKVTLRT